MALGIYVIDRRVPSNKIHCQLHPKKALLAFYIAAKILPALYN